MSTAVEFSPSASDELVLSLLSEMYRPFLALPCGFLELAPDDKAGYWFVAEWHKSAGAARHRFVMASEGYRLFGVGIDKGRSV